MQHFRYVPVQVFFVLPVLVFFVLALPLKHADEKYTMYVYENSFTSIVGVTGTNVLLEFLLQFLCERNQAYLANAL